MSRRPLVALVLGVAALVWPTHVDAAPQPSPTVEGRWLYVAAEMNRTTKYPMGLMDFDQNGIATLQLIKMGYARTIQQTPPVEEVNVAGPWQGAAGHAKGTLSRTGGNETPVPFLAVVKDGQLVLKIIRTGQRNATLRFVPFTTKRYESAVEQLANVRAGVIPEAVRKAMEQSKKNLRELTRRLVSYLGEGLRWKRIGLSGKNFVLFLVAKGLLHPDKPADRALLVSPGDRELLGKIGQLDYSGITMRTIKNGTFGAHTSYAGRRNRMRDYQIPSGTGKHLLFVDTHFSKYGVLLLAWSDGTQSQYALDTEYLDSPSTSYLAEDAEDPLLASISSF